MANYLKILNEVAKNYACRKRIEEIERYLERRLGQELQIKYIKPLIEEQPAFKSLPHPLGGEMTTYPRLGTRQNLDPFNYYYMKPIIKGHEYKHFLAHSLPYNLSYIYGLKVYDRARLSNQKLSRYDIAQKIKAWLNYKYEPDYTRLDYIKDRVDDYDEYLDAMENEENIYYDCSDLEEELFDDYKMLIGEMDFD